MKITFSLSDLGNGMNAIFEGIVLLIINSKEIKQEDKIKFLNNWGVKIEKQKERDGE